MNFLVIGAVLVGALLLVVIGRAMTTRHKARESRSMRDHLERVSHKQDGSGY